MDAREAARLDRNQPVEVIHCELVILLLLRIISRIISRIAPRERGEGSSRALVVR